jgi:hypothetical protein
MPGCCRIKASTPGINLSQALSHGDQAEQCRGCDRQAPHRVDPAPANANPRRDSLLWRHPVIETDAIVGIAKFRTQRLVQLIVRTCRHQSMAFCHRVAGPSGPAPPSLSQLDRVGARWFQSLDVSKLSRGVRRSRLQTRSRLVDSRRSDRHPITELVILTLPAGMN